MKKLGIGVVAIIWIGTLALLWQSSALAVLANDEEATLRLDRSLQRGFTEEILAICDEGNGTMLYVVSTTHGASITSIPHGCK